jgi:hypothetical protein
MKISGLETILTLVPLQSYSKTRARFDSAIKLYRLSGPYTSKGTDWARHVIYNFFTHRIRA